MLSLLGGLFLKIAHQQWTAVHWRDCATVLAVEMGADLQSNYLQPNYLQSNYWQLASVSNV